MTAEPILFITLSLLEPLGETELNEAVPFEPLRTMFNVFVPLTEAETRLTQPTVGWKIPRILSPPEPLAINLADWKVEPLYPSKPRTRTTVAVLASCK